MKKSDRYSLQIGGTMTKSFLCFVVSIAGFLLLNGNANPQKNERLASLEIPVGKAGTVSFILKTDKTYQNGAGEENFEQILLELPELARIGFRNTEEFVQIILFWNDRVMDSKNVERKFTELPGGDKYFILFTWDSEKGLVDAYINGFPFRSPSVTCNPWIIEKEVKHVRIPQGPIRITEITTLPRYVQTEDATAYVPEDLKGKGKHLLGTNDVAPMNMSAKKGDLLYASELNNEQSIKGWVLEGLGDIFFENGQMMMRSQTLNPEIRGTEHFNFWCPADFPESFVAEWEFRAIQPYGMSLVFFAAQGKTGEDIFDPSLPKRDGRYALQYAKGAINNYHILFFANHVMSVNSRMYSILYKNQYIVKTGPIAVSPDALGFHSMCLIKDGAHIQLQADGKVYVDFTDPGTDRWGPVYGSGKISFRQMSYTVGAYRNFRVWKLR